LQIESAAQPEKALVITAMLFGFDLMIASLKKRRHSWLFGTLSFSYLSDNQLRGSGMGVRVRKTHSQPRR
jgi:hypothetical protein